jgi:hypothetical protein
VAQGEDIVPVVGARRRNQLAEALSALDVMLTPEDLAKIEGAVPKDAVAGDRYPAPEMVRLDSERAHHGPREAKAGGKALTRRE